MTVRKYTELIAWRRAMDLVQTVYEIVRELPAEERYGLGTQMRKASVSVPTNIAEGQGRKTSPEFRRYLSIALGSLTELETELFLVSRLQLGPEMRVQSALDLAAEVGRLTNGLYRSLPQRRTERRSLATDH